eukprot:gene1803-biopygen676
MERVPSSIPRRRVGAHAARARGEKQHCLGAAPIPADRFAYILVAPTSPVRGTFAFCSALARKAAPGLVGAVFHRSWARRTFTTLSPLHPPPTPVVNVCTALRRAGVFAEPDLIVSTAHRTRFTHVGSAAPLRRLSL